MLPQGKAKPGAHPSLVICHPNDQHHPDITPFCPFSPSQPHSPAGWGQDALFVRNTTLPAPRAGSLSEILDQKLIWSHFLTRSTHTHPRPYTYGNGTLEKQGDTPTAKPLRKPLELILEGEKHTDPYTNTKAESPELAARSPRPHRYPKSSSRSPQARGSPARHQEKEKNEKHTKNHRTPLFFFSMGRGKGASGDLPG